MQFRRAVSAPALAAGLSLLLVLTPPVAALAPAFALTGQATEKETPGVQDETSAAEKPEFVIASADDWKLFAEAAHTDAWSKGRTVRLASDIRLSGEADRIVFFSGIFDGGGHTIDGVSIRTGVSGAGLFEQLEAGGEIRDLKVSGAIQPSGSQTVLGGLVGVNRGMINNCTWFGSVEAHRCVGGIAGRNEAGGIISGCSAGGILQSDTEAGGIAGHNAGLIRNCTSDTQVDTVYTDVPFSTDDLTLSLNEILQTGRVTTVDNANQKTDIGGIAGYNIGTVEDCTNSGKVGYEHVGYCIGGIAGRTTGLVRGCTNEGEVYGRREVGGIVGQQQPDLSVDFTKGKLAQINTELDTLQGMIDSTLTDTDNYSNEASGILSELSRLTGVAKGDVKTITDEAANRADAEAARANDVTGRVKASAHDLSEASDDLSDAGDKAIDYTKSVVNAGVGNTSSVAGCLDQISDAFGSIIGSVYTIRTLRNTQNGGSDPEDDFDKHVSELLIILQPVIDGRNGNASGDNAIYNALDKGNGRDSFVNGLSARDLYKLTAAVSALNTTISAYTSESVGVLPRDLDTVTVGTTPAEKAEITTQLVTIRAAQEVVRANTTALDAAAASSLQGAASGNEDKLSRAKKDLENAFGEVSEAFDRMSGMDLSVSGVSAASRAASGDLYATIDRMIAQSDALNASVRGATSGTVGNLKAINDQMGRISDLISEAVDEELNRSTDPADYTQDISAEDFETSSSGRTTGCINKGNVYVDADGGGIAGLMGINNQINPEQDIAVLSNRTTHATMLEKAIVDDCENTGRVTCSGNYAGGITGRMQLGIIYGCHSLGMVDATGDYAGGIAGFSGAVVKNCLARTHVNGNSYVGGITGSGDVLTDNKAMVRIPDTATNAGAIAGAVEEISEERLQRNVWSGGSRHAIGDVDYAGLAQETGYEEITADDQGMFKSIRLTFLTDDTEVGEVICGYGDSLGASAIPQVPSRDGFYGAWDRTDFDHVTEEDRIHAVYTRVVTLIAGDWKREADSRTVFFAAGAFAPDDEIEVTDVQVLTDEKTGLITQEQYALKLPDDVRPDQSVRIRFLADPKAHGEPVFYDLSQDGEVRLETETMGEYYTFAATGPTVRFAVRYNADQIMRIAIAVLCGVVPVIAVIVIVLLVRHAKKRKKAAASEEAVEETAEEATEEPIKETVEETDGEKGDKDSEESSDAK